MRTISKSNRTSLRRSLHTIKGVPYTSITLHSKLSANKKAEEHSMNSILSRFHHLGNKLRVVSIGTSCQKKKTKSMN
jgi:hypothetical protein